MIDVTVQLPDQLAGQIMPARRWLPAVLELGLARFKTPAAATSSEIIDFLLRNPGADEVLSYHVSDRAQRRLQRLLAMNAGGVLSEAEAEELAELERLEHMLILIKVQAAEEARRV